MEIRSINSADASQLYRLWKAELNSRWPISEKVLSNALGLENVGGNALRFGTWQDQVFCGAITAELVGESAAITFIAVDVQHQRHGIATQLVHNLIEDLKKRGVRSVSLGAGARKLLWHGVPTSLSAACNFFRRAGFELEETSYDLIQNISNFHASPETLRCCENYSVKLQVLGLNDSNDFLKFELKYFPEWHKYFENSIAKDRHSDVLIARKGEQVIGSVLLSIVPDCPGAHWNEFLGPKLGAFGILGVVPEHREHGVGLALATYATETLRDRGVQNCFLHWTWLRDWYGKLGFKVWEEYKMGRIKLGN